MTQSIPKPEVVSEKEFLAVLEWLNIADRETAKALLSSPSIGLSGLKMRNDLSRAAGALYCLDGFGAVDNAGRRAAINAFGARAVNQAAASEILSAAVAVRTGMSLAQFPIPYMAVEFYDGAISELKSYVRADRLNERIEDGRLVTDRPTTTEESMPTLEACFRGIGEVGRGKATTVLESAIEHGALLELAGLDYGRGGEREVKLYFCADANKIESGFPAELAAGVLETALAAGNVLADYQSTEFFIRSMIDSGLSCSQIAVGFSDQGQINTKLYFDAWEATFHAKPMIDDAAILRAMKECYRFTGVPQSDDNITQFLQAVSSRSMVMETIAVDIAHDVRGVKAYINTPRDRGLGIRPASVQP